MAAPWEEYAPQKGPWEEYQQTAAPDENIPRSIGNRAWSFMNAGAAGVNTGIAYIAGLPVDTIQNAEDLLKAGIGTTYRGITGKDIPSFLQISDEERANNIGGGESIRRLMNRLPGNPADNPDPSSAANRYAFAAGTAVPALLAENPAGMARALPRVMAPALAAQGANEAFPDSNLAPVVAALGAAAAPSAASALRNRFSPAKPAALPAPTKEELRIASKAAYRRSEDAGAVISPESFDRARASIDDMLKRDGIDPSLHPSTTAALKRINETSGPVTLEQLETLRKIAKDAQSTINSADKRLATRTVDAIDEFADGLTGADLTNGSPEAATALKEARNLYSRSAKADTLDELMRRAEISAPNFSGSGMENAIRTEFRTLAKNSRKMRLFTAEERAAIERVAKGGPVENVLRMAGKFAPTGVVSTALSAGAGFAAGGPAGAAALPALGAAARYGAGKLTMGNVQRANEIMRRGPPGSAPLRREPLTQGLPPQLGTGNVEFSPQGYVVPPEALRRSGDLELAPEGVLNPVQLPEKPSFLTADAIPALNGDIRFSASWPKIESALSLAPETVPQGIPYRPPTFEDSLSADTRFADPAYEQLGLRVDTPQPPPFNLEQPQGVLGRTPSKKAFRVDESGNKIKKRGRRGPLSIEKE